MVQEHQVLPALPDLSGVAFRGRPRVTLEVLLRVEVHLRDHEVRAVHQVLDVQLIALCESVTRRCSGDLHQAFEAMGGLGIEHIRRRSL